MAASAAARTPARGRAGAPALVLVRASDRGPARATTPPRAARVPAARVPAARVPAAPARPAPARRPVPAPVRLTRRGRMVAGGLAAAAALAASLLLGGGALASSHGSPGAGYQGLRRVVVQPGQTLWSLAEQAEPSADPRMVIPQILSANSLTTATIYPGEQLWVPR